MNAICGVRLEERLSTVFYLLTLTWTAVDKDESYQADVDRCVFQIYNRPRRRYRRIDERVTLGGGKRRRDPENMFDSAKSPFFMTT